MSFAAAALATFLERVKLTGVPLHLPWKPRLSRVRSQFPQFLHQQRYDELRKIWLTQGIPTYVARKLDSVTDHGGWETF